MTAHSRNFADRLNFVLRHVPKIAVVGHTGVAEIARMTPDELSLIRGRHRSFGDCLASWINPKCHAVFAVVHRT